jgi:hypothetical protein
MGFVFAALLQLLSREGPLSGAQEFTVGFLLAAMFLLLYGLILQHLTANRVVKFWDIFFPKSWARYTGGILFSLGILFMLISTITMLFAKTLCGLALLACAATLVLPWLCVLMALCHKGGAYVRNVDKGHHQAKPHVATTQ